MLLQHLLSREIVMSGSALAHRSWFISGFFALLLTACAAGNTDGLDGTKPPTKVVSGTVQAWTEGKATVRAVASDYGEVYRDVPLAKGNLEADGRFSLTLPPADDIPDNVVYPAKFLFSCIKGISGGYEGETGSVEVVPANLGYVYLEAFAVFLPGTYANREGDLYYRGDGAETDATYNVLYLYATADGTVKGRCTTSAGDNEDGYDTSDSYDLTLKAGWNEVVATNTSSLRSVTSSLQTGPLPQGLTWQYLDYSDFPKGGPGR